MNINYKRDLAGVDWQEIKKTLVEDDFDNGRTPAQLKLSFENSAVTCLAYAEGRIIGTARALSDGVCNAYVVDVWTLTEFRRQGVARKMMELMLADLTGQHVYLFTDDAQEFYKKLGFQEQHIGLEIMIGHWLKNDSAD